MLLRTMKQALFASSIDQGRLETSLARHPYKRYCGVAAMIRKLLFISSAISYFHVIDHIQLR